jgi:hypothetical protein
MTHIMANFGGIESGAQVQRQGATTLRQSGDETQSRFVSSGDYWSDGANLEQVATGQQWWTTNDASAEEADRRGGAMNTASADYQGCLQQSIGIVSRLG